ncbi:MAG: sigma 54-interacting transcriptional regulator [Desulfobacterales bacterium]|nr:sigma 54-interacting transcriptional regulator [Desulfobacterales bacterium]HIJ55318.1 sigma 54-interacting transcriptional regulator [Deltaproteobacteria bacterium]
MGEKSKHQFNRYLELDYADFLSIFDKFAEGVVIVNKSGVIVYYNHTMAKIDDLDPAEVFNKRVTEVYDIIDDTSMVMQCLKKQQPLINRPFFYRTRMGKVANTIHNTFPLFRGQRLVGAICFVRDYKLVEETIASIALPRKKRRSDNNARFTFIDIIGENADFRHCVNTAMMASHSPSPVMLCGETGTGKELFAQSIHNYSDRRRRRYIPLNCTAIPENLLEGILFGTTKGAFTGSLDKPGLFERANGGTLFLDEVNSMPCGLQAKILRALQERKVRRVGSLEEIDVDVKIISSVSQDPHRAIAEQSLRSDLFYRLGVVFIRIPPLRERRDDIPTLVEYFLNKLGPALGKQVAGVADEVMAQFLAYPWPGNARELEHVLEGAINMAWDRETITLDHLRTHFFYGDGAERRPAALTSGVGGNFAQTPANAHPQPLRYPLPRYAGPPDSTINGQTLVEAQQMREQQAIQQALARHRGNVTRGAQSLGISRQLLNYKIRKYGFDRKQFQRQTHSS